MARQQAAVIGHHARPFMQQCSGTTLIRILPCCAAQSEVASEAKEREALEAKISAMESKVLHGGVNLLDKVSQGGGGSSRSPGGCSRSRCHVHARLEAVPVIVLR
jgi:hypothetical protein